MGCVWCKPSAIEDSKDSPRERFSSKSSSEFRVSRPLASFRREETVVRTKERSDVVSVRPMLSSNSNKQANVSMHLRGENLSRREKKIENVATSHLGIGISIGKATQGEYVAAGWPPWLASVAGEAIKGWVPRRADSFEKLDKVSNLLCFLFSALSLFDSMTYLYWHVSIFRNIS